MDVQASIHYDEATTAEVSKKRKRDAEDDHEGPEQKKVYIENGTLGIEALHRDVGSPYRLASTPYPRQEIDLTVDLFKVYSLEEIAASVARGGENPVKMGKTYKKHMRTMKLSGKFDAVKKRENDGLFDMLIIPDEEWKAKEIQGKDLRAGLGAAARSSLPQAMSMLKGRIPKDLWDPAALALNEPTVNVAAAARHAAGSHGKTFGQGANLAAAAARQTKTAMEQARPQRSNKKRSYTEETYAGYSESYTEGAFNDDDGASRQGDEDRQQRRKKQSTEYGRIQSAMQRASYGSSTVGA